MIRMSKLVAENENYKFEVFIKFDDKGKPGAAAGMCGRLTNRYNEQLFEFFNANEVKVVEYAEEIKDEPAAVKKKGKKK